MRFSLGTFVIVLGLSVTAGAADSVKIHEGIGEGAPRVRVPLEVTRQEQGGSSSEGEIHSANIPADVAEAVGPDYPLYWDLGSHLGAQFFVVGQKISDMDVLGRHNQQGFLRARIYRREKGDIARSAEEVTSGVILLNSGNSIEIPVEVQVSSLGANGVSSVHGVVFVRPSTSSGQPTFYASSRLHLQVSGSTLLPSAKLVTSIQNLTTITLSKSQRVSLTIEPFSSGTPPRTISGKLGDVLDLRGAHVVVEEVAHDLSELVVAVVQGSLEEASSFQASLVSNLPPMAQVELFERRLVTDADLLAAASKSNGVVLIFGEFKDEPPNPHMHSPAQNRGSLQLSEQAIMNILTNGNASAATAPRVIFVVRQLFLKKLYEDYLGAKPQFDVLSDYSDVMHTTFRSNPQPGAHYFHSGQDQRSRATLREAMGIPDGSVSVVLLDRSGKVVYSKVDAGDDLTTALVEAGKHAAEIGAGVQP